MKIIIAASLFILMLSSCSEPVQLTSTATAIPTLVATVTRIPSPSPSPVPATESPQTQSASEWNGIPIMPGAIAGEGDEEGYVFTIHATPAQVQEYYHLELEKLGWQLSSQEDGDSSMTLLFMNNTSATLTVSIVSKGDQALVLLVK